MDKRDEVKNRRQTIAFLRYYRENKLKIPELNPAIIIEEIENQKTKQDNKCCFVLMDLL